PSHPVIEIEPEVRHQVPRKLSHLPDGQAPQNRAGPVGAMRPMKNKPGDNLCFVTLDDRTGRVEVALFADIYDKVRDVVAKDRVLVVEAIIAHDDYSGGLKATGRNVMEISQARLNFAKAIRIRVDGDRHEDSLCADLKRLLQPLENGCPVVLDFHNSLARCDIQLGERWRVNPS